MKMIAPHPLARVLAAGLLLAATAAAAPAQIRPETMKALDGVFEEAKTAFFSAVGRLLESPPMKDRLEEADRAKLADARREIPGLFERLMIYAFQKDEPRYRDWAARGDEASIGLFRRDFTALAEEYAARFVGSLFRTSRLADFSAALPFNRGKSRLGLVLRSIGFEAKSGRPEIPREGWFRNVMKPEYSSQWALDALRVRPCWPASRGGGVVVAVIDSGLDPFNSLFKDRTVAGFNFLARTTAPWTDENPPMIDWGMHGTGCSSCVLAVAPDCRIMPVRVHDGETMNDPVHDYWIYEFIAAGIYYAVHHGAQVISLSAPLPATELPLREAVRCAYEANVPLCTSAGNISRIQFGLRLEDLIFKAMGREVILAGGVSRRDGSLIPWPVTVPHDEIDVAAPSEDVFVVVPVYMEGMQDMAVAGTSLSAPLAAGVAALLRGAAPPSPALLRTPGAYSRLVEACLKETARLDVLGLDGPDDVVGRGLIDAEAAVKKMRASIANGR